MSWRSPPSRGRAAPRAAPPIARGARWLLYGVAFFAAAPALAGQQRLTLALAVGVPVAAVLLALLGRGVFSLSGTDRATRQELLGPMVLNGIMLAVMASGMVTVGTVRLERDWPPLGWAAAACIPLALLTRAAEPAFRGRAPALVLATLVAWAPWAWGSLVLADVWLDRAGPEVFEARVVDRWRSGTFRGGRITGRQTERRRMRVSPWGPFAREVEVGVGAALWESVEVGDVVCVSLSPGALGFRWFKAGVCPARPSLR